MLLVRLLVYVAVALLKFALFVPGVFVVPFIDSRRNRIWGNMIEPEAPAWFAPKLPGKVADYLWLAWRNPVNNMRFWFDQPMIDDRNNPDDLVRTQLHKSASRCVQTGVYFEYWYLRYSPRFSRYLEVRIGWKFSGVPGFGVTWQTRFGKT